MPLGPFSPLRLLAPARRYARWLHTGWPAGAVEPLPEVLDEAGRTAVPGLHVVGDLTGIPLLKLALDSGVRAVRAIAAEPGARGPIGAEAPWDLAIVGAGPAGIAAAVEAKAQGLRAVVFEAAQPFSTIANFPRQKPIFVYPSELTPQGAVQVSAEVKEALLAELEAQRRQHGVEPVLARIERVERRGGELLLHRQGDAPARARRVIVAIGRSGDFRRLGAPGEELDKVTNRLHDPRAFAGQRVLVVGGGDSAAEAALALAEAGAQVVLSYRQPALSRPKPENQARLVELAARGGLRLALATEVVRIEPEAVTLRVKDGAEERLANDAVLLMLGREAPLDFFRRAGVPIRGEWRGRSIASFALFLLLCALLYLWKAGPASPLYPGEATFPRTLPALAASWTGLGEGWVAATRDRATLLGTVLVSAKAPAFWYTLAYTALIGVFGWRRIRRRRTPYVTAQTVTLFLFQLVPLFLLPEVLLPWAGYNGWFQGGWAARVAHELFPLYTASDAVWPEWGHPRAYWQAYGFVLAWPLFVWNVFQAHPSTTWLVISGVQTFLLIPLLVWRWGKGAYCGWICSCGALAETLGDQHRTRMPHGPRWNRLDLVGQVLLAFAFLLLGLRVAGWAAGQESRLYRLLLDGAPLSWKWLVDLTLAGVVGVGCYFWLSGRVWCRFACPLAALMHIYARLFTRFRIFADKKRCISCNVCTAVCHQGIDVMSFANKGLPMQDPECVRCSACVQSCPTGTLGFGRLGRDGTPILDRLAASPVQMAELAAPRGRALPVVG